MLLIGLQIMKERQKISKTSFICISLMPNMKTIYLGLHVMGNSIAGLLPTVTEKILFMAA